MRRVGVREFRDHATRYLHGDEPLAIERHGETIGYYYPTKSPARKARAAEAMRKFEETIEKVLAETGMTEEELASFFDLSRPLPDSDVSQTDETHAAGS